VSHSRQACGRLGSGSLRAEMEHTNFYTNLGKQTETSSSAEQENLA